MKNEIDEKIENFIKKVELSKENKLDLSKDEDLSIAIMNLISIEEHFFFTAKKTQNEKYFDLLNEVRSVRKEMLKKIIKNEDGEVWCISKHLLAASMRLMEVGTKSLGQNNKKEANEFFEKAFDIYNLFWGINLGAISTENIKKIDDQSVDAKDEKKSVLKKLGDLVRAAIDCCIE
ncbi:MAG: hypothetical protein BWY43_00611 [candidate division WS2 bacterium ADurb.Bin280]|uniref:Uncharacterized protein n=1 Tax=candidate division WS2 bacterium ADurb.Bin280 TaxID=1852829 RepID=A0A1V5SCC1_9BACT|nr:MAG: hypothetical protein BWY43_00611 [candidate division WS2 bacterium ADurb.Bin280]